jgi:HAE1 family hydrophobic/amphiphilic exporter-1
MALYSPTLPLSIVNEYAETLMAQRISMVDGVAQVQVYGSQKYAVRVRLDPEAPREPRHRASTRSAPRSRSTTSTSPPASSTATASPCRFIATGQLANAAAFTQIVVAYRNGAPVRLGELAQVIDSVQNARGELVLRRQRWPRTIMLIDPTQPGTNTVEVIDRVRALLPTFMKQLPPSVTLSTSVLRELGPSPFAIP